MHGYKLLNAILTEMKTWAKKHIFFDLLGSKDSRNFRETCWKGNLKRPRLLGRRMHNRKCSMRRLWEPACLSARPRNGPNVTGVPLLFFFPFSFFERRSKLQRKDRSHSDEKQTPKIPAHRRRKEDAEKKMEYQHAFCTRKRSSRLKNLTAESQKKLRGQGEREQMHRSN